MHRAYLILAAVAIALYALLPSTLFYQAIALSGVLAILVGIKVNQPVRRLPWYLFALGQGTWFIGDVLYDNFDLTYSPSLADAAYLLAYPLLGAGLVLMIADRSRGRDLAGLIDSLIVTVGFGLLSWVFITDPIVDDTTTPMIERAVAAAYPLGDILLMALVIRLVTAPGERSPAFRLMVGSMGLVIAADTSFAAAPSPDYASALDLLWLASYVLWGATALHPTMHQLSTRPRPRARAFSSRRLVALAAAMLIAPILVAAKLAESIHVDTWLVTGGACVLTLLVVGRMAYNIEEIRTTQSQRDKLRSDLLHEASHDSLTGTANSAHMQQLITAALRRGQRSSSPVGLLIIDLDEFAAINNRHGHGVGDDVLRDVARRLQGAVRDVDTVGRLAGDQFAMLIESMGSDHEAADLATRLTDTISEPIRVPGGVATVTACIGTTTSLDGGTDADAFLLEANIALRRAKAAGHGRIEEFDNRLRSELAARGILETELRSALEAAELEIHYQPVIELPSALIDGLEARVRWNRSGSELLDLESILPVTASSDLVCDIDRWTLTQATARLSALTDEDPIWYASLTVTVPLSTQLLSSSSLLPDVERALSSAGLAPHRLSIAVSEMALVEIPNLTLALSTLRRAGVGVTIHDFGTGRTPLGQLRHLPADALKVHESLIDTDEAGGYDLLILLVNAAHSCGLLVVAEGAEHLSMPADLRALADDRFLETPPAPRLRIVRDD